MKNKKNILIVNEYAGSPKYGMNYRHYYLAKEFISRGYNVTIVSASYSHLLSEYPKVDKTYTEEDIDGITYLWIKVNKYKSSFDKKRVLKWFEFTSKLFFISKKLPYKPDFVIWSATEPFSILSSYYLAKKNNAKFIYEVKDIWPLTLINLGSFSEKHPLIKAMYWLQDFALKKADIVVSNLQNYSTYIKELHIQKSAEWISNGIDLEEMGKIEALENEVLDKIPSDKFIVGYTGKLGVSNAVSILIETAEKLQDFSDIVFVIVGDGQEKIILMERAKNLENVIFIEPIKKVQVQSMLTLFDICYIGWRKEDIYKYGISPNKLFEYMYSGKAVLHSTDTTNDIVQLGNAGISVAAENSDAIKDAILKLYHMNKKERERLGNNGKEYVLKHFTYQALTKKYIDILENNEKI